MALAGNTVRLTCVFKTWGGVVADPTNIQLKIYDDQNILITAIPIGEEYRIAPGTYQYDYTLPTQYDSIAYEYSGISEGSTILGRDVIPLTWQKNMINGII